MMCVHTVLAKNEYNNKYSLSHRVVFLVDVCCPFFDESSHFAHIAVLHRIKKSGLSK